jgi:hypothetical protein
MPYIKQVERERCTVHNTVGGLTYALTREAMGFVRLQGPLRFMTIALVMGAFFCAALEFYRRVAVPYENAKMAENGDVYS